MLMSSKVKTVRRATEWMVKRASVYSTFTYLLRCRFKVLFSTSMINWNWNLEVDCLDQIFDLYSDAPKAIVSKAIVSKIYQEDVCNLMTVKSLLELKIFTDRILYRRGNKSKLGVYLFKPPGRLIFCLD